MAAMIHYPDHHRHRRHSNTHDNQRTRGRDGEDFENNGWGVALHRKTGDMPEGSEHIPIKVKVEENKHTGQGQGQGQGQGV